jgi:putative ABC transport system permease protein
LPGVTAVSAVTTLPLGGSNNQSSYMLQDKPEPERGRKPNAEVAIVTPEYFATMGIQILQGRGITADDRKDTRKVALVDTEFVAKNFAPGESPLGKRFVFGGRPEKAEDWIEIVGVVEHIQNYGLGQPTREQTYQPLAQRPPSFFSVVLRTGPAPGTIIDSVRRAMREIAPDLPIVNLRTMDELFDQSIGAQRITVILLAAFAGLGLSLAGVGLYGVISYSVTLRTREIGVRMALGAEPGNVLRHVLRQGLKLAVLGLLLGLVGGVFATKLLQSVLYEVSRFDLLSFATVAVVLASVGVCACWIPARRATRINPTEALRAD